MTNGEQTVVVDDQLSGTSLPAQEAATGGETVQASGQTEAQPPASIPAAVASPEPAANPQLAPETTTSPVAQPTAASLSAASSAGEPAASEGTAPSTGATAEPAPSTEPAASSSEAVAGEPSRRRVQLNPTVSPEQLRPIPTYGSEASESAPAASPITTSEPKAAASASVSSTPAPVNLPPESTPLDSQLAAEIDAALASSLSGTAPSGATPQAPVPPSEDELQPGTQLKAKVQSVTAENVFCDVGYRVPALIPLKQFPQGKHPRVGEEFLVIADRFDPDSGVIQANLPKAIRRTRGNWEELSVGQVVECYVTKTNKGGLEVTVSNLRGFLPASQVEVGFVSSLEAYVGQKFPVQITEVNPAKRNLVVSRRALLLEERKQAAANFWQKVEVGQQYRGTVKTIKDYGAFVDLGGVDGFLHVGEMSWTRIKHPSDILQEGQTIDVMILSLDREKQKIGLGMRQLTQNPWHTAAEKYPVGRVVSGRVTRVTDFGAFVELEPGVEGLIHISELDHRRVKRVSDVLTVGQEVQSQVLEVAPDRQRISLSLKALKEKPEEPKDEDRAPSKGEPYERKRKEPLRGGTGSVTTGGLFGNPSDFAN